MTDNKMTIQEILDRIKKSKTFFYQNTFVRNVGATQRRIISITDTEYRFIDKTGPYTAEGVSTDMSAVFEVHPV